MAVVFDGSNRFRVIYDSYWTIFSFINSFVKFRDMSYIWEIVLQAGFYASGVISQLQIFLLNTENICFLINGANTAKMLANQFYLPLRLIPFGILVRAG